MEYAKYYKYTIIIARVPDSVGLTVSKKLLIVSDMLNGIIPYLFTFDNKWKENIYTDWELTH